MFRHRIRLSVVGVAAYTALSLSGAPVTPEAALERIEAGDDKTFDVYNLQGMPVRRGVMADNATQGLPPGIYIVDGKKISVK